MKKKQKFTVVGKTLFISISIPIEVGQVKLDKILSLSIYPAKETDKLLFDVDDADYQNTTYMGMEVDGYRGFDKLRTFHKELGIDIDDLISKEVNKKVTHEDIDKWVNETYKDIF